MYLKAVAKQSGKGENQTCELSGVTVLAHDQTRLPAPQNGLLNVELTCLIAFDSG
jgi:hypothetical protein